MSRRVKHYPHLSPSSASVPFPPQPSPESPKLKAKPKPVKKTAKKVVGSKK